MLRGLKALAVNPFYLLLVQEAQEMANRQLAEIMSDDGTNIPQHFKAVGFVNGLEQFKSILDEKIAHYQQKTKEDYAEKPIES